MSWGWQAQARCVSASWHAKSMSLFRQAGQNMCIVLPEHQCPCHFTEHLEKAEPPVTGACG